MLFVEFQRENIYPTILFRNVTVRCDGAGDVPWERLGVQSHSLSGSRPRIVDPDVKKIEAQPWQQAEAATQQTCSGRQLAIGHREDRGCLWGSAAER